MNKTILSTIFILLLIQTILSLEIDFSCPKEVLINEEFECQIIIQNTTNTYDIKVEILNEKTNLAEIKDESTWKSAYYYLNEFISSNEEKNIQLKIIKNHTGKINATLKLRKGSFREFYNFDIIIKENKNQIIKEKETKKETTQIKNTTQPINNTPKDSSQDIIQLNQIQTILTPTTTKEQIVFQSKNEIMKKYSMIAFSFLCLIFAILAILKRI